MIQRIADFSTAKDFVGAWIEFKKSKRAGFSMRRLCALLELKSPSYLKLVLDGKRNLSIDLGLKLSKQMGLGKRESDYFISLIEAENAPGTHAQELGEKKVLRGRRHLKTEAISEEKHELISRWYHMLVRELTFLPDFSSDPAYIVRKLGGCISKVEAHASIAMLTRNGLIAQRENGQWYSTDKVLDTGDSTFGRQAMVAHHGATLKMWSENLGRLGINEQELGLLHVPIASAKIPELRRRIRDFQDELIGWLMTESKPDRVVQVGTYLIPFDGLHAVDQDV